MSTFAVIATFLYGLVYIPFSYLSSGFKSSKPLIAVAVILTMSSIWTVARFWRRIYLDARVALCGLFNAGIIISTIEAMSFPGGPVFKTVMVIKAGVLGLMFYADKVSKNRIRWHSIAAGLFALSAIVLMNLHKLNAGAPEMPLMLKFWYTVCVLCYAIKLPLFSFIKRQEQSDRISFLISHQTWSVAFFSAYCFLRYGLPSSFDWPSMGIGLTSQLTGVFGSAILLSDEEHSACVPMKTAGALIASFVSSVALLQAPTLGQAIGFFALIIAVIILQFRGR